MKLLHSSDWHLGQSFMGKSRLDEHSYFLEFLLKTIVKEEIDTLVVAGDIFDTGTPPNYALELYYNFLTKLSQTPCENIIIIAGNHDSVATLKAPQQLLKALHIHLITTGDESEDEVIKIYKDKELVAIVCAVPFLRDYVVRKSLAGESVTEKQFALNEGIKAHYKEVYKKALLASSNKDIPIIATGHLTTVGATSSESEREIYIGNSLSIESGFLSEMFSYVALGHLHINQKVGSPYVRYSGSPIALSFSEASKAKKFNIVSFEGNDVEVEEVEIPQYRELVVVKGDKESVIRHLETIKDKRCWIEVHLDDENPFYANQIIREKAEQLHLTLLALKIENKEESQKRKQQKILSLDELTPLELFERRLEDDELSDEVLKEELRDSFKKIVAELNI
jgi:exonuclease SbcD